MVAVNMLAYVNKIWPQEMLVEASLADRPYTVFYAHTHMYKYEQRLGCDYINLATTGGVFFGCPLRY
jgi:hypothetical protein